MVVNYLHEIISFEGFYKNYIEYSLLYYRNLFTNNVPTIKLFVSDDELFLGYYDSNNKLISTKNYNNTVKGFLDAVKELNQMFSGV